jgi:L,D-peptidoglycan transpeptidase YkuD (ErfK/YbiS/YcfS/YnhG family)
MLALAMSAVSMAACTSSHRSVVSASTSSTAGSLAVASSEAPGLTESTPVTSSPPAAANNVEGSPSASALVVISPPARTVSAPAKPPAPTKPPPTTAPLLVEQLASLGDATQVVIVTSAGFSTSVATLQTFEKDAAGWHAVFPAMAAHIGRAGFAADKHEGDLKTPVGKYGFGTMFGQRANPGVKFPYRVADAQSVWVDDVSSAFYNTWQENAALSGEHLASAGFATAYAYAVDIGYNTSPVIAGKGSAIFLHVSTGGGTAGCVSIAQANLLEVLRWLDPAKHPVIVMGPTSVVRQY